MAPRDPVLAVDVGGTKIAVGLVEPGGRLASWAHTQTPRGMEAEQLWRTLDVLCTRLLAEQHVVAPEGLAGVGCGCGGPLEWPAGRVSPLNIPAWRSFPLRDRLKERFPGRPVRLHNDAICMTAGEHWRGAGRGRRNVLGMVVSTGVGGGLVLDGRLINGATGNAGHIGMWWWTRSGRPARAVGAAAWRPSREGPRWPPGRRVRGGGPASHRGPPRNSPTTRRTATRSGSPPCGGPARPWASPSPPPLSSLIWRWSRSGAGWPRPGRCCSIRWKRRCAPTPGWTTRGMCRWSPPGSARAPG